ncbi:MAG: UvrD-helicase domain-containing protein [Deltaproteobacteria bacterium]|jgi:uncharacterized protein (TIGR00375 family)|nr:UvrD-helicase domain-containing protein [Deltaproteobacteria bacterium]
MHKQEFRADLHIHSRFSRATSSRLNAPLLAGWAALKGLHVLGTGDFTHPGWRAELAEALEPVPDGGLYRLKRPEEAGALLSDLADTPLMRERVGEIRFMLQAEISSIYKRDGRVRKIHNLVFMPNFEAADRFCLKLGQAGNLESDGRPILGLDARDLLELVLESDPHAYLIPAHIWTPWFSLFGSNSGFDRIEDCFGPLSEHIFALETGLSSDPEMNRRLSALDRFRLVSNSDAHSGEKLAREANLFSGEMSYTGIFDALRTDGGKGADTRFLGTCEFFPDEGKYHLDGHRDCSVALSPEETRALGGICPVCGRPLTVGVLNRVLELADRSAPLYRPDEAFCSLIPLPEIVGEILGAGVNSQKVARFYHGLLRDFGAELDILLQTPADDLARRSSALAEGIVRMRRGEVIRQGGYDGKFGVIRVFRSEEGRDLKCGAARTALLPAASSATKPEAAKYPVPAASSPVPDSFAPSALIPATPSTPQKTDSTESAAGPGDSKTEGGSYTEGLNARQRAAVLAGPGPVLALAGPGTGKTHTLVARILRLAEEGTPLGEILALTFTRRAARELDERLRAAFSGRRWAQTPEGELALPRSDTLHALALDFWYKTKGAAPLVLNEEAAWRVFVGANPLEATPRRRQAWDALNLCREKRVPVPEELQECAQRYHEHKTAWGQADYTDLLEFWLYRRRPGTAHTEDSGWTQVLVDEIQDLSPLQLELIAAIIPEGGRGFFGIGDPNQSIYGFRGAHGRAGEFFARQWPRIQIITLRENFRSAKGILRCAQVLARELPGVGELEAKSPLPAEIYYFEAHNAESEAAWVAGRIRACLGATSHSLLKSAGDSQEAYSPGDFAVLLRSRALMPHFAQALERAGVPFSQPAAEVFWEDSRVALILRMAGRVLGINPPLNAEPEQAQNLWPVECPERVLAHGPEALAAYYGSREPFDAAFWKSKPFKQLSQAFDQNQGWSELFNWISLRNELEELSLKSEKVQLLTLHAAKGLEFRMVFLPALEDGLLPFAGPEFWENVRGVGSTQAACTGERLAEELRLFYVGLTRAAQGLFLSRAEERQIYGKIHRLAPSPFLRRLSELEVRHSRAKAIHSSGKEQMKLI